MISFLQQMVHHRELIANLVSREMKSRYKGSVLGFLWSLLTPLFMALIYMVFLRILAGRAVSMEEIIIGVFAWQFTVVSVQGGMTSVTGNSNLVKKVCFPRFLLPLSVTAANLINFLLTLIIQFVMVGVMLAMKGQFIEWTAIAVPLVILHHTVFNLGIAFLLSSLNVYYRDTQHLVGVLISAWFFMSPAMYNLALVERVAASRPVLLNLYMLNPMAPIITAYRALILPGVGFPLTPWMGAGLIWPIVFAVLAYFYFKRTQNLFADLL